jgi:hypothetical protein
MLSFDENTIAMMTPYIATTSQKIMEIRFFVRMRGALTPPPRIDEPVIKMPLIYVSLVEL